MTRSRPGQSHTRTIAKESADVIGRICAGLGGTVMSPLLYRGKRETIGETITLSNDCARPRASSGGRAGARPLIGMALGRRRRGSAAHRSRRHKSDRH